MKRSIPFLIILFSAISITFLFGRSFRVNQMPNGSNFACANCHINPNGGGARNGFGQDVEALVSPGGSETFWSSTLASLDSDDDGFTNGEELQDPTGSWIVGTSQPGDNSLVTNPGDGGNFPVSVEQLTEIPNKYLLGNNYPNPFNPTTTIKFSIPVSSNVLIEVYSTVGEKVRTLVNENYSTGSYSALWNGKNDFGIKVNSGIYIYRMVANNFTDTKRMVVLK